MTEEAALLAQFRAVERSLSLSLGPAPQVPADVRWAPARAFAPDSEAAAIRVRAAEQALQSFDLGSMQEEALLAVVAAGSSWDAASGYGAVEANRATIGHPVAITTQVPADVRWAPAGTSTPASASEASHAGLARGTRAESPTLSAILHGADSGRATSEDRIANALFGDQSSGYGS